MCSENYRKKKRKKRPPEASNEAQWQRKEHCSIQSRHCDEQQDSLLETSAAMFS